MSHLQGQAVALFGLAEDAFGKGKPQLGEELTALALRYLNEADALESSPSPRGRAAAPGHATATAGPASRQRQGIDREPAGPFFSCLEPTEPARRRPRGGPGELAGAFSREARRQMLTFR
jgi:hypothetical protein